MSSEKSESLAEVWGARYDDRDAEDLACENWARRMALRDQAVAQPIRNFVVPDDAAPVADLPETGNGPTTPS
jgi:hypothetical protein